MLRMSMEHAALAGEIRETATEDFDALVRMHQPRVFRFILASVRNRETAENLTQECFIRAYNARRQFRGDSNPGTWLMRIAANLVRSHEGSSRLKFWRRALKPDREGSPEQIEWVPDRQISPEAIASARERLAAIWKAAARLPERQRTVFLLRFVEDMELLEISAVTGMKEGTVKTHLFRALKTVRSAIEENK
ncbi:MAG: RNA polymerase sigma factor [Bryobacterales bacterium]|nr:RNA polymerase sigma factor [Bryobacterales bacterium]MBV9399113.1 RNA polymerase sigma factor [Bryobacterales bacterium]